MECCSLGMKLAMEVCTHGRFARVTMTTWPCAHARSTKASTFVARLSSARTSSECPLPGLTCSAMESRQSSPQSWRMNVVGNKVSSQSRTMKAWSFCANLDWLSRRIIGARFSDISNALGLKPFSRNAFGPKLGRCPVSDMMKPETDKFLQCSTRPAWRDILRVLLLLTCPANVLFSDRLLASGVMAWLDGLAADLPDRSVAEESRSAAESWLSRLRSAAILPTRGSKGSSEPVAPPSSAAWPTCRRWFTHASRSASFSTASIVRASAKASS
mmetsp:Transcript_127904/g.368457  ORF Transcript_127904/g.368457 Transcript_127904/m.368457 type:complete len:272 (+) Transcript_127904:645-1460(+)